MFKNARSNHVWLSENSQREVAISGFQDLSTVLMILIRYVGLLLYFS